MIYRTTLGADLNILPNRCSFIISNRWRTTTCMPHFHCVTHRSRDLCQMCNIDHGPSQCVQSHEGMHTARIQRPSARKAAEVVGILVGVGFCSNN